MATTSCPRCQQPVDSQAISCPFCRTTLKAYGHPGIPLHRAKGKEYLCDSCTYHADNSCNFPQRPYAKDCTLYENLEQSKLEREKQPYSSNFGINVKSWVNRNQTWLLLLGLLFVCFLIAMSLS
ncbi:zinc ribbon domain-containing protein [Nostocaceae cyanobacterium CENA369]|uniref:Zinc ribbon domain-containing protein n=1 Tax=Dendronalium phyllosphericum CENA369 TaxID=1725256 RepID=A0A8J7HXY4_9NOST|nr:zinc ribbon domain-containing protein [Dendronalium phyllosphericum]MBH8572279.1 zinc ribbon domain-containing protein [Dendronalium phyllosphericum CENA369]